MILGNEGMSTGGDSANVDSTVISDAAEASDDGDDAEGDDGEDAIPTYEEWLEKNKDFGKKKETKSAKSEDSKGQQTEGKSDEKARTAKNSDDSKGAKNDDVSGKGDGKDRPADTFKLKVDGEEIELTKDQAIAKLQKYEAAEARIKEATEIKKQAGEFINFVKKNPIEAMKRIGVDFTKLAEDHIYEQLQYKAMSESERAAYDKTKDLEAKASELERYKAQEQEASKAAAEKAEKERIEKATSEARVVLERQMIQAMETTGLPANTFTVTRMALYMKDALSKGHKNITPMDVAGLVKRDYAEAIEQARKAEVKNFKSQPMKDQAPKSTAHKPVKTRKRISSIYDLID